MPVETVGDKGRYRAEHCVQHDALRHLGRTLPPRRAHQPEQRRRQPMRQRVEAKPSISSAGCAVPCEALVGVLIALRVIAEPLLNRVQTRGLYQVSEVMTPTGIPEVA